MNYTPARNDNAISSCRMVREGAVFFGTNGRKRLIPLPTIAEVQENEEQGVQEDNKEDAVSKTSHYLGLQARKGTRESPKELDMHVNVEIKSSDSRFVGVACVVALIAFLMKAWK